MVWEATLKHSGITLSSLSYSIFAPGVATLKSVESFHIYTGATQEDLIQNAHMCFEQTFITENRGPAKHDAQSGSQKFPKDCFLAVRLLGPDYQPHSI